ncbi:MAG: dihydrodipicolinate synthase family protein [Microbacterium sp.]
MTHESTQAAARGAWPVMLTPYDEAGEVDLDAVARYTDWLIASGATGLFPVALSGEMYELTPEERLAVARRVVESARGRVRVAASVLGDGSPGSLIAEARALAGAGVDVVVLIASHVLAEESDEESLAELADAVAAAVPDVALGLYECPLPYHRLLSEELVGRLAATGRFTFFKETSHDVERMAARVGVAEGTPLSVFNAGIENYAESIAVGVSGLSGWIVTVAPDLVARLGALAAAEGLSPRVRELQDALVAIERRMGPTYPGSAKGLLEHRAGLGWSTRSRWRPADVDQALVDELAEAVEALG